MATAEKMGMAGSKKKTRKAPAKKQTTSSRPKRSLLGPGEFYPPGYGLAQKGCEIRDRRTHWTYFFTGTVVHASTIRAVMAAEGLPTANVLVRGFRVAVVTTHAELETVGKISKIPLIGKLRGDQLSAAIRWTESNVLEEGKRRFRARKVSDEEQRAAMTAYVQAKEEVEALTKKLLEAEQNLRQQGTRLLNCYGTQEIVLRHTALRASYNGETVYWSELER